MERKRESFTPLLTNVGRAALETAIKDAGYSTPKSFVDETGLEYQSLLAAFHGQRPLSMKYAAQLQEKLGGKSPTFLQQYVTNGSADGAHLVPQIAPLYVPLNTVYRTLARENPTAANMMREELKSLTEKYALMQNSVNAAKRKLLRMAREDPEKLKRMLDQLDKEGS